MALPAFSVNGHDEKTIGWGQAQQKFELNKNPMLDDLLPNLCCYSTTKNVFSYILFHLNTV